MQTPLFRQVSLERLSSPEQLDQLLVIVKIKGWIALLTLLLLLISLLTWSFLGRIPITASGKGVLLDPRGLQTVSSRTNGRVLRIFIQTGQEIKKNQVLLILDNPLLERKERELIQEIANLQEDLFKEKALVEEEMKLRKVEAERKLKLETLLLENYQAKLALLKHELSLCKTEEKSRLEQEILEQKNVVETQNASMDLAQMQLMLQQTNERVWDLERALITQKEELHGIQAQKEDLAVKAPVEGQIIEIDTAVGRAIEAGEPLFWIQAAERKKLLSFYSFVPLQTGMQIQVGMSAQISLMNVDAQSYGQIAGKVSRSLPYAAALSAQYLAGIPSRILKEYLQADPAAHLVVIDPLLDPSAPTGYRWTTGKGPSPEEIQPGAVGEVLTLLESKRPISYAIPIFKE